MEVRSGIAAAKEARAALGTGSDSPVRLDSSISRELASRIRQSAGTLSPARSRTTSPGTSSPGSATRSVPARLTRTPCADFPSSRSIASLARYPSTPPTRAFRNMMLPIRAASVTEPTAAASPAPAPRIGVSGLSSSAVTDRASSRAAGRDQQDDAPGPLEGADSPREAIPTLHDPIGMQPDRPARIVSGDDHLQARVTARRHQVLRAGP